MMTIRKVGALSALTLACVQAHALEFKTENGLEGKINGVLTLGTQIRTKDPSPDAYSAVVSPSVPGVPRGHLAGQNGGPDLNFYKGDQISTVLKGVVDVDLKKGDIGFFVRANAWKDFALGENNVAYGNFPNGFTPHMPLSDQGFAGSSKFSNAEIRDVFLYGSTALSDGKKLEGRFGRQVLNWGGARLIGGGINSVINPTDFSSQFRPGAQAFEGKLPLGMLSAKLVAGEAWSMEGFAAFEHRGNVYAGCGTYFDVTSFIAQGCNMISFAGASEQQRLATNQYVHRTPDADPKGLGHYGLSAGFKSDALKTDFRLYAMNTTAVTPSFRMTVNSTTPSSPANSNYGLIYPENVSLFGVSFSKKISPELTTYGEIAYRPNQPISFNASDLLGAFYGRSPNSLLALRKNILAVPVGGTFDAYDRFGVVTGSMGASKIFSKALGAARVVLTGEVGFSHINGLPSQDMLRFGRGTAFGAAAYVGPTGALTACNETVGGKQCTKEGYVTSNAWGLRVGASAVYPDALAGATWTTSILVGKDVKGYSFDGTFSEGRAAARVGVRAEWSKKYFAEVQLSKYLGGRYNLMVDRDYLTMVAGVRL
ncbi:DUF1302 domain-containing protein [Alicycliphilus sp. T452]|jgi:hypothetical protein